MLRHAVCAVLGDRLRLLAWKSSTKIWAQLHEQAFRRLGGTTATVVLDNLKEGVLTPARKDPTSNPTFSATARNALGRHGTAKCEE